MNKIIVRSIVYSASLLMILGLASCGTAITPPIYQGMSIERNTATVSAHPLNGEGGSSSATSENDQGEDDPSIDDSELASQVIGEDIEDIVDIVVEGDSGTKYYVSKGEAFQVSINIYNPSQFEILSFTLNGYKYANNMFAYGSTLSKILIDMTAGTESGLFEYTIDAIKYVDGTKIKDVVMDGEKTIKTGVKYDVEPSASVTNQTIHTTSISMRINISDAYDLIGENELKVYLSDGETVIGSQDLIVGNNDIEFTGLKMGKLYQYAVMTAYDVVDGNGMLVRTLAKAEFETLKAFLIDNLSVGQENVSFEIAEYGEIGTLTSISLHDDSEGYPAVQVPTDLETRTFSGLFTDHAYILRIEYSYLNGTETLYETDLVRFTTLSKVVPTVSFSNIDSDQDSVFFTLAISDVDRVGSLTKIELFRGATLIQSLTDLSKRAFDGLLSNNTYTVTATYEYDLNDGFGMKPIVINASKATLAKATPTMAFTDAVAEQESITFELGINDIDSVGSLTSVELLKGATVVETMAVYEDTTFYGLLSDTAYILRATYTYNLNDGAGNQTLVVTQNIRTLAKAVPVIEIYDVSSTQESISFDIDVLDSDGVGHISAIELYEDENLISTYEFYQDSWPTIFTFTGLLSNEEYTIRVSYNYDLSDGTGSHTTTATLNQPTLGEAITVSSINILNTTNPKVGEEIHIRILLTNPDNILIRSFFINGIEYSVVGGNVTESAIIKFIPKNFIGGEYEVKIDAITYLSYGRVLKQLITSEFSDNIIVLGSIDAMRIYNLDHNVIYQDLQQKYIFLDFINPTNYDLSEITISGSVFSQLDITKISQNTFRVNFIWGSSTELTLNSFKYGISGQEQSLKEISTVKAPFTVVANSVYREISTATQLANLESGYAYKMTNDIDLTSFSWISKSFSGVLNGQGYTIKNFALVVENESQSNQHYGLFSGFYGSLFNLSFKDVYLNVKTTGSSYVGVIAGNAITSLIESVFVSGIINNDNGSVGGLVGYPSGTTITNSYNTGSVTGSSNVGGLVGYASGTTITNSYNTGSVTGSSYYVGGLVGYASGTNTITNSYNTGSVTGSSYVGGLVGVAGGATITNSYNTGSVTGSSYVGGLVGYASGTNTITNSYNTGSVTGSSYVGGLVGYAGGTTITNSYFFCEVINENGIPFDHNGYGVRLESLEDINYDFIVNVLGWDESVWNLSELNVSEGFYPQLFLS